jgi:hypothetical protein
MSALILVTGIILLIMSIIDWKFKSLPSILLTGILFVVAFISTSTNPMSLNLGILGLIMAYLLYEAGFMGGIADVKVMTMISFMLLNTYWLLASFVLLGVYGLAWKGIVKLRFGKEKEFAFVPVFLFVYISLFLLGGLF